MFAQWVRQRVREPERNRRESKTMVAYRLIVRTPEATFDNSLVSRSSLACTNARENSLGYLALVADNYPPSLRERQREREIKRRRELGESRTKENRSRLDPWSKSFRPSQMVTPNVCSSVCIECTSVVVKTATYVIRKDNFSGNFLATHFLQWQTIFARIVENHDNWMKHFYQAVAIFIYYFSGNFVFV